MPIVSPVNAYFAIFHTSLTWFIYLTFRYVVGRLFKYTLHPQVFEIRVMVLMHLSILSHRRIDLVQGVVNEKVDTVNVRKVQRLWADVIEVSIRALAT
jgi:hypothetical protein